jgi:chaperonin GroES
MRLKIWQGRGLAQKLATAKPSVQKHIINLTTLTSNTTMVAEAEVKVSVKPLADRVLVEAAPAEEKTSFGIIIPDTAKEKPQRGTVVAVGNGKKDEPMTVKIGDTVLYGKYAGTEITVEGKEYLIMRESDIFAIL